MGNQTNLIELCSTTARQNIVAFYTDTAILGQQTFMGSYRNNCLRGFVNFKFLNGSKLGPILGFEDFNWNSVLLLK